MQTQSQTIALPLTTSQLSVSFITSVVCGKFVVHTRCASTAGGRVLPVTRYSRAVAYTLQKRQNKYTHRSTQIYSSTSGSHHRQRAASECAQYRLLRHRIRRRYVHVYGRVKFVVGRTAARWCSKINSCPN